MKEALPQSNAQRDYGLAVRCEAVALPRRKAEIIEWGSAPESPLIREIAQFKKGAARHQLPAYGGA